MIHTLTLKNWYYNAGVIGFLRVLLEDKLFAESDRLEIEDNQFAFDDTHLEGFVEGFERLAFLSFFDIRPFQTRLEFLKQQQSGEKKKKPAAVWKSLGKPHILFYTVMGIAFEEPRTELELSQKLDAGIARLKDYEPVEKLWDYLQGSSAGKGYIDYFLSLKLRGIVDRKSLGKYIAEVKALDYGEIDQLKTKDVCLFCQHGKSAYDFNNGISNIIGFNKDNTNWVWGYKAAKIRVCALCALVYACAILGFVFLVKKAGNDYLNYLYFINANTDVETLYNVNMNFHKAMLRERSPGNFRSNAFYMIIKETISRVNKAQWEKTAANLHFLEIADNPILGGQSTKGYNIYNYNVPVETARFLKDKIDHQKIPQGYYVLNKSSYNIDEELIRLTLNQQLSYQKLASYFYYAVTRSSTVQTHYNLNRITRYIFSAINKLGGEKMDRESLYKQGFRNGVEITKVLKKKNRLNQLDGLVYGFLNSLKIADRDKFLDKYFRLVMAHDQPVLYPKEAMIDGEAFLQFGYSFVNGLLAKKEDKKTEGGKA